jgi:hypothetical protein
MVLVTVMTMPPGKNCEPKGVSGMKLYLIVTVSGL